jgi:nucleolar pre-ribosomal-associated protein 1
MSCCRYWPHSGLSVEPRLNAKWLATIAFLGKITILPIPDESTFYLPSTLVAETTSTSEHIPKATPPSVATMIEAILPAPLTKAHLTKGLSQPVGLLQHQTALALARCLRKLTQVQKLLAKIAADAQDDLAGNEREKENLWTRPEVGVIIAFAQRSAASQALQASLEEEDTSAKAKSELLTESALRLFGLYYQALPTMAAEFKFDVGKLLVSSSSAKAEAQARKAAREGSVVDDTGSIASVGTTGTAGMGGGFGQARGDVQAFDALSQIHVLELLANVKEWDWTGKAGTRNVVFCLFLVSDR